MGTAMIRLNEISYSYPSGPVLDHFSLAFQTDRINCLLGPSGCGKTTLLNLIAGLIIPQSGTIVNQPQQVSYIFQETRILPWKTVYENVIFPLKGRMKTHEIAEEAKRCLEHVGMWDKRNAYPHELSGGMRQRVSIARAFAFPSSVILMDEAFQGLDVTLKERLLEDFSSSWQEDPRTVIFVTHDLDEAIFLAHHIMVLPEAPIRSAEVFEIGELPARTSKSGEDLKKKLKKLMASQ